MTKSENTPSRYGSNRKIHLFMLKKKLSVQQSEKLKNEFSSYNLHRRYPSYRLPFGFIGKRCIFLAMTLELVA